MENLKIEATKYIPEVFFDAVNNTLLLKGKSYPENTAEFYAPIFSWLDEYLQKVKSSENIIVNIELTYFNSSSSKVLMNFFDILDQAAEKGLLITVNWIYDSEDENILEYGEEFREDLENLKFNLVQK